jgi:hypothetical protein
MEDIMESAKNIMNRTLEFLKRSTIVGKLMMEKSLLERSRRHLFQHLGELTYSLCKANKIKEESIQDLIAEIDTSNQKIREKWSKLEMHIHK